MQVPRLTGQRPGVIQTTHSSFAFVHFIIKSCHSIYIIPKIKLLPSLTMLRKIFKKWLDLSLIKKQVSYSQFSHVGFKFKHRTNPSWLFRWTHRSVLFNTTFILSITLWEDFKDSLHKISSLLSTIVTIKLKKKMNKYRLRKQVKLCTLYTTHALLN